MPIIFLLPIILAIQLPVVNWSTENKDHLRIEAVGDVDPVLTNCLKKGIAVKYRFAIKKCHRRRAWVDECSEEIQQVNTLRFDPILRIYDLSVDIFRDELAPENRSYTNISDGFKAAAIAGKFAVSQMKTASEFGKEYFAVRVISSCERDSVLSFTWLPYVMTFGLYKPGRFDSEWKFFQRE